MCIRVHLFGTAQERLLLGLLLSGLFVGGNLLLGGSLLLGNLLVGDLSLTQTKIHIHYPQFESIQIEKNY